MSQSVNAAGQLYVLLAGGESMGAKEYNNECRV